MRLIMLAGIATLMLAMSAPAQGQVKNPRYREVPAKSFIESKITYLPLEGAMRYPNSAWGSIGIAKEGFIYIMVCDHISNAEIFEYNMKTGKLFTLGTLAENLSLKQWALRQPKVHSQVYQHAKSGLIYFGTDAGDRSEGGTYDQADEGYYGGYLCDLNPVTKEIRNLGLAAPHAGVKCLVVDSDNDAVYMNLSNGTRFVRYDIKTGRFDDLGRVHGRDIPRTLFFDRWNNVYNFTEAGVLLRYRPDRDALEFLSSKISGTYSISQAAYAPDRSFIYYVGGYTSGDIWKYTPEKEGPGRFDSLGSFSDNKGDVSVRNLGFSNGKLCAVVPTKEISEGGDTTKPTFLKVFDPGTKKFEKIVTMNKCAGACYGHPITDAAGNCYTVVFGDVDKTKEGDIKRASVHLVIYNPKSL